MIGRNIKVFEPVNLVKRIYALERKSSFIMFKLIVKTQKDYKNRNTLLRSYKDDEDRNYVPKQKTTEKEKPYLRLDTNVKNVRARRMYKTPGYREIGIVDTTFNGIAGVKLVLLEKIATIE